MSGTVLLTAIPMVLQLLEVGLPVAEELISAAKAEASLVTAVAPPTTEQQAAIDAATDVAEAALQAAQPSA